MNYTAIDIDVNIEEINKVLAGIQEPSSTPSLQELSNQLVSL